MSWIIKNTFFFILRLWCQRLYTNQVWFSDQNMDGQNSVLDKRFREKMDSEEGFFRFSWSFILILKLTIWKPFKLGPFWYNYEGLAPKQPYQPEYVIFTIWKYKNGTVTPRYAEIHSDNLDSYRSAVGWTAVGWNSG